MPVLIVVDHPENWPLRLPEVEVLGARRYLTQPPEEGRRGVQVFNLCRSYAYQSLGYYVTLLAEARGQRPKPGVAAIQDLRSRSVAGLVSAELAREIQRVLKPLRSDQFVLSVYFGQPLAKRHQRLASTLFNQFEAPLLRARFRRVKDEWQLTGVSAIPASEVPESHRPFLMEQAQRYFRGRHTGRRNKRPPKAHLALLVDPDEKEPPSNPGALKRFTRAAEELGLAVETIGREDAGRINEFDALFIRTTTSVDHFTFRLARRAEMAGLVVVDDPTSIVRCTNKVYLKELLERIGLRIPRTLIVHRDNRDDVVPTLGLPVVLKKPDSAFSIGVVKAKDADELRTHLDALLEDSDLVVAQEFLPTEYDWRIGVLDGRAVYACRYFMVRKHWQILHHSSSGRVRGGKVETLPVEEVPNNVLRAALKATRAIGDGLYGVDLKVSKGRPYVIEVNDNPSLDHGYEDAVLGDELWRQLAQFFVDRIEARRQGAR